MNRTADEIQGDECVHDLEPVTGPASVSGVVGQDGAAAVEAVPGSGRAHTERVDSVGDPQEQWLLPSAQLSDAGAPGSILIAPWGEVKSLNGRFIVDASSAQAVVSAFAAHGTDLPIDYEHQSLGGVYASPNGQAPAAGWIKALRAVEPAGDGAEVAGLWAEVSWTHSGAARIAAREYRYLSPVVMVRKGDRRVVSLHSAALTNKPAIAGMRPIVNRAGQEQFHPAVEPVSGIDPAGRAADEPMDETVEAVDLLRLSLGLDEACGVEAVLLAARQQVESLREAETVRQAEERVQAATRAGKLAPAQRAWALELAMKNPACFAEWEATAPRVIVLGRSVPPSAGRGAGSDRQAVIASARRAFRAEPWLAEVTDESAWVRDALREAQLPADED